MRKALIALAVSLVVFGGAAAYAIQDSKTSSIQAELTKTLVASAQTRITTVQSRCDLTKLLISDARPAARPAFQASYDKCVKQLAVVKQIAAGAPQP